MLKKIVIFLILLFVSVVTSELLNSNAVASEPLNYDEPTSVLDTLIGSDSIVVIHTVCAPICSSHVRVYNKEWQYLGALKAPFKSAFPEAYIENNQLLWRDNDTFDYTPCR